MRAEQVPRLPTTLATTLIVWQIMHGISITPIYERIRSVRSCRMHGAFMTFTVMCGSIATTVSWHIRAMR